VRARYQETPWDSRDVDDYDLEVIARRDFVRQFGQDYQHGQHLTILGPTGRGKSQLCYQLLDVVIDEDHPVVSLHGKIRGRDPVVGKAGKALHLRDVDHLPSRSRMYYDRKRHWRGYIICPLRKPTDSARERELLHTAFKDAVNRNYQTTKRNTITHINEAHQAQADLKLKEDIEAPLMRGGPDNAVWHEGQRGAYLSYHTYNAPEHIFIFYDPDKANRKRYADLGCADPDEVYWITSNLKTAKARDGRTISQCLYVRRSGGMYVVDI